ncbi:hypothetical protein [Rubritalea halochordaticola]|uniref:hypothetical protein n=1 Tax=Rubritalea halochordaticola TaxID=714537 RepID=UPI0031FD1DC0
MTCFHCVTTSALAEVKPLSSYPSSSRIWIGAEDGQIQAANEEHFRAPNAVYVTIHKANGSRLSKDEHWATIGADELELERRSLEIERKKTETALRELKQEQQDLIDGTTIRIEELEAKKFELSMSLNESELSKKLSQRINEAIASLDQKIAHLKEKIDPERLEQDTQTKTEELNLTLERKEKEFAKRKKKSTLKAPFDGTLILTGEQVIAAAEKKEPVWLEPAVLFASLSDKSYYEIFFSTKNPIFTTGNLENFSAMIETGSNGKIIKAKYHETRKIDGGSSIKDVVVFRINKEDSASASLSAQQSRVALIFKNFPESYKVVQKKNIALLAPDILESKGWAGLVKHLWPEARIVEIGAQTIALKSADAN